MKLLYIDLFCGAGGTSTGVEDSGMAKVIACVNHDKNAIASHAANHPDALHFTEDIRTLNLDRLIQHIASMRKLYPNAKIVLWASLECTNFSKAKGGQPPDYIQIENVEEFMRWGDLDENGKPISKRKGTAYIKWVNSVCDYGYDFDYRILNAADFGAYTSRKRFFGIFAKEGLPIVFPEQTHSKIVSKSSEPTLFEQKSFKKWKPVKDVLDFSDEGESIFMRKKPLSDKTLERIYAGLIKFVAGGKDKWLLKYNSINGVTGKHIPPSIDEPCPVVSTQGRLGIVQAKFLSKQFSGHPESKNISVEEPAGAITTIDHHALVSTDFISRYNSVRPEDTCKSIDEPCGVVTTNNRFAKVQAKFLSAYYGNGYNQNVEKPCPALTTKDRLALISSCFLDMQYGNGTPASVNEPALTVTTNPKHQLVSCQPWVMNTNFGNVGSSINEPSPVITANRKWHYLMNPQFASAGGSVDNPCFTLIARMDKMPPYLVATESGIAIQIYEEDTDTMRKIKEFMAIYGIADIKMRMLKIPELKQIMGFPKNYVLIGTQAEQKKYIGNAVEVTMAKVMCLSLARELNKMSA